MSDDRYVFLVEWFDSAASLVRPYHFIFFTKDKTIQMFDIKNKRTFLKRCDYPSIALKDIFVGATLNVYSRQLKVVDFGDEFTKNMFSSQKGKSFLLLKPDVYLHFGKIINLVQQNGFTVSNFKMAKLAKADVDKLLPQVKNSQSVDFLCSDLVLGIEVIAEDCVARLKGLVGNPDPKRAKQQNSKSIRGMFGSDSIRNAVYCSESASAAARQIEFFFSAQSPLRTPAYFNNCSCVLIKPHLITEGYAGQIIDSILTAGFQISAGEIFWLDRPSAQEFLQVYKGVVPEYNQVVEELTNGPCIALEVRQQNAVQQVRELCGPHDPEMARTVRPKSLRAVYGKDKAKNGVHCTDLPEDGVLEVEYFFNILQRK